MGVPMVYVYASGLLDPTLESTLQEVYGYPYIAATSLWVAPSFQTP
jgi:hypothetical protein